MKIEEVIDLMIVELDYYAREYQNYTDAKTRENITSEFKAHVRSYNALLRNIYRKVSHVTFTPKIEDYIEDYIERNKGA
jgi:hypothetical protein